MNVLLTGGAGYVGSHAVRELVAAGHSVVVYDSLVTGHSALAEGFPLIVADIADRDALRDALRGVDAVMHFAASASVSESMRNPQKYLRNNVTAALHLLETAVECHIKLFIFSSSCAVYGVPDTLPIVESSATRPLNAYGETKLILERALAAYSHANLMNYVALRYFNAAGAHVDGSLGEHHDPETHVIPLAMKAALGKGPRLRVFGSNLPTKDGTCIRDFIHVSDLGLAHVKALDYLARGGPSISLNLGTGKGTSILELLSLMEKVMDKPVPCEFSQPRLGDPPALYADPRLAMATLHWEPRFDLEDILRTAWSWECTGLPRLMTSEAYSAVR